MSKLKKTDINKWTKETALPKIKIFCAYQERCHKEVEEKLLKHGLKHKEIGELITILISENYLNEERFVKQFAGSKYRMKSWGKEKIKIALKQKGIQSNYLMNIALKEIDDDDYLKNLQKIAQKKYASVNDANYLSKLNKTKNYLLQKGYSLSDVLDTINKLRKE